MRWLPRISDGYWLTPLQIKLAELVFTMLGLLTFTYGMITMFGYVWPLIQWCVGIAGVIMLAWICVMQYTRFKENYFRDEGTEKEEASSHFAFIPYLLIPLLIGVACGVIALGTTEFIASMHWISTSEQIVFVFALVADVLYICADYRLVSRIGDVAYMMTLEGKITETAEGVVRNGLTVIIDGKSVTADKDTILSLLEKK